MRIASASGAWSLKRRSRFNQTTRKDGKADMAQSQPFIKSVRTSGMDSGLA